METSRVQYWKNRLPEGLPVLELPTEGHDDGVKDYSGLREAIPLSDDLVVALSNIGKEYQTTLPIVLLTVLCTLLRRYTSQEDITVGWAHDIDANQRNSESVLPVRVSFDNQSEFVSLIKDVSNQTCLALENQLSLCDIFHIVGHTPKNQGRPNPLFQVLYSFTESIGLASKYHCEPPADIAFRFERNTGRAVGWIEYNTNLYARGTIARMAQHFTNIGKMFVVNAYQKVSDFDFLELSERDLLLNVWNATGTTYPKNRCVHDLFEEQVLRTPDAIAVRYADQQLSYIELNRKANQLAHYLQEKGVSVETRVGLCVERSLELIVGMLAIIKAGGAFVHMSTTLPSERIAFLMADTKAHVFLTMNSMVEKLPDFGREVICFDRDHAVIETRSDKNPGVAVAPDNLVYIIYTSGSTGAPKGVLATHKGVVRLVKSTNYFRFTPDEVFLQFAPVSFDAATFEIWGALLNGAQLAIAPAGELSLERIGDTIKSFGVTSAWLTAAIFHQMVEYRIDDLRGLRQLIAGGESLSVNHVRTALRELPNCRLVNGYGPTENTTFSTAFAVSTLADNATNVPIGPAISNSTCYVLDNLMYLVPVGVPGELYVGGDGLARGFLGRPELTAEKFVPHPFGNPGERLYRSGDLARFREDGAIEFLGRIDRQVKIKGFRIELGEIESALSSHPQVRECAILAPNDQMTGHRRLVGYYVADNPVVVAELRNFLKYKLPEYMVPGIYVHLNHMPVTQNGKLDQRALPSPSDERPFQSIAFEPPRSDVEDAIVGIWRDVLGFKTIGVKDDFFDLGGHPLLGTLIIAKLNAVFSIDFPLDKMMIKPTVAEMASVVRTMTEQASSSRKGVIA